MRENAESDSSLRHVGISPPESLVRYRGRPFTKVLVSSWKKTPKYQYLALCLYQMIYAGSDRGGLGGRASVFRS
jgi:hypothetical protein